MHDRDRVDPALRLAEGLPGRGLARRQPAGLQPEQGRDRLQVVLHPVVDLPDGGFLADQLALPAPQLGHVPAEHQRGRPLAVGRERDDPQPHGGPPGLDLGHPGHRAADDRRQCLVDRVGTPGQAGGDRAQLGPDQVGGQPQPPVRRHRIGAGERHDPALVQPDQPVTDARGQGHLWRAVGHREAALGDHHGEVVGGAQVGELQPARRPSGREVGVPADDGQHPALPQHRDRLLAHRHVARPVGVALPADPLLVVRRVQLRPPAARSLRADEVVMVRRGPGRRPDVCRSNEATAVAHRQPQHEVGEREVGEQLPVGQQPVQPLDVLAGQRGAWREVGERGHGLEPRVPPVSSRSEPEPPEHRSRQGAYPAHHGPERTRHPDGLLPGTDGLGDGPGHGVRGGGERRSGRPAVILVRTKPGRTTTTCTPVRCSESPRPLGEGVDAGLGRPVDEGGPTPALRGHRGQEDQRAVALAAMAWHRSPRVAV